MSQGLVGGIHDSLNDTTTEYNNIIGGQVWGTTEWQYTGVVSPAGTFKNLKVRLTGAPGAGKSYTFTLRVDGVNSTLTCTISGTNTSASDVTHSVAVTANSRVTLECAPSGTPSTTEAKWSMEFVSTLPGERLLVFSSVGLTKTATRYLPVSSPDLNSGESDTYRVIPCAGTLKNFYIQLSEAPGTGSDEYKFTLRKNGADQSAVIRIIGTDTTGSDTANEISVAAGDYVNWKIDPVSSPANSPVTAGGMTFLPDDHTLGALLGGSSDNLNVASIEYNSLHSGGISIDWNATEVQVQQRSSGVILSNLHVKITSAPGAGTSYTFTVRDDGVDTALTCTIEGASATTGSDTTHKIVVADGSLLSLKVTPLGTPGTKDAWWGVSSAPAYNANFRILYPSGYSSYDYTYLSDKPGASDHQFREFEWRDQNKIPNIVYVLANQAADGNWDSVIIGGGEQYDNVNNNEYPDIVEYYIASTLTTQGNADARAAAIALRRWMEAPLGRVVVPHNCGQELYDWIKIRDKRPTSSYVDYPTTRWGNTAVVGSLTHVYDPANGIYDLEITINGIDSSAPVDATIPVRSVEEEVLALEEETKGVVKRLEAGEERMYFPTEFPLTEYGQQRLSEQMGALMEQYGAEELRERFLKASEEFRKTERWQEEERRWAVGETWSQREAKAQEFTRAYKENLARLREVERYGFRE